MQPRPLFAALAALLIIAAGPTRAAPATPPSASVPVVQLWRLDCGEIQMNDMSPLSDAGDYQGQSHRLTDSCYLVQHGSEYLLWDAGLEVSLLGKPFDPHAPLSPTLARSLTDQLRTIGVRPEQIGRLGLSHYHFDHAGQAAAFPGATLLIGAGDWAALKSDATPFGAEKPLLAHWLQGGGKVDPVSGDRDVFGDGTVVMLTAPGHTPGSSALLVRLPRTGPVILSGDVVHLEAQWSRRAVPTWNVNRAESLASMERLQRLAANLKARIVVQHDPADIGALARFPEASR